MKRLAFILALCATTATPQQTRIASDFEIEQMERQLARSQRFLSQLSGRLNLGDLRTARNEISAARAEYVKARDIAERERTDARRSSDLARYATATMYDGLAEAKLGNARRSFDLLEEAGRYASDDARTWNLYSSAMTILGYPRKAIAASRNAVAIAELEVAKSPTVGNRLDLAIDRYSLATALLATGNESQGERLLVTVVDTLTSPDFDSLERAVVRKESFEIYSTAPGEEAAYLSLLNRAQLRLAALYESQGDNARAQRTYENVLALRSDEPTALAALARLADASKERERYFADAFDANPFSISLIREYHLHGAPAPALSGVEGTSPSAPDSDATGARVRRALQQMARGENRAARATLDALLAEFRANDTLNYLAASNDIALGDTDRARSREITNAELRREIESRIPGSYDTLPSFLDGKTMTTTPSAAELRRLMALLANNRLAPEQRVALDRVTFKSVVTFDSEARTGEVPSTPLRTGAGTPHTVFEWGTIDGVPFRFSEPTVFAGSFSASQRLLLTYRILGATHGNGADALLLAPMRLEVAK